MEVSGVRKTISERGERGRVVVGRTNERTNEKKIIRSTISVILVTHKMLYESLIEPCVSLYVNYKK